MMDRVIAKFYVSSVQTFGYTDPATGEPVVSCVSPILNAVYAPNDPDSENGKFWEATPTGEVKMQINNRGAFDFFKPGEEVYVTFHKGKPR